MSTQSLSLPHPGPPRSRRERSGTADPGVLCEAAAAAAVASEPRDLEQPWIKDLAVQATPYSIRIPVPAGETRCGRCLSPFLAAGPTGFAAERPICDLCLLDGSQPLGMLLALAAVVRTFGAVEPELEGEYREASEELAAFARIYERVAAKSGPPRAFEFPEDLEL